MNLSAAAVTFALILVAELPDKTFIATLVLSTRYRPLAVWCGVAAAFAVQSAIAVSAGQLLSLLPRTPVLVITSVLFAAGAVLMFRAARAHPGSTDIADELGAESERIESMATAEGTTASSGRAFLISFGVLFAAEWGDLSQLTTASLSARFDEPVQVFVGAWLALVTVAGLAVVAGRWLATRLRFAVIQRLSAVLLATLSLLTALEAAGVSLLVSSW